MNKGPAESQVLVSALKEKLGRISDREICVFPPYVSIPAVASVLEGSQIHFGAQNVFYEPPGPFTGEIPIEFLVELGCKYVIIGHSERRALGEDDDTINMKLKRLAGSNIIPVLCIGERLDHREQGETFRVIENQLKIDLAGVNQPYIIAYEPIWAIGTGKTARPDQASEVHAFIRGWLRDAGHAAKDAVIIYGGSVNDRNIDQLMAEEEIDGVLVGGASLDPEKFVRIVRFKE